MDYDGPIAVYPVPSSELLVGNSYFMLNFIDNDMFLPTIQTLIYLGKNISQEYENKFVFQDIESFTYLGAYPNNATSGDSEYVNIFSCDLENLNGIYDLDSVVEILHDCSNRRKRLNPV